MIEFNIQSYIPDTDNTMLVLVVLGEDALSVATILAQCMLPIADEMRMSAPVAMGGGSSGRAIVTLHGRSENQPLAAQRLFTVRDVSRQTHQKVSERGEAQSGQGNEGRAHPHDRRDGARSVEATRARYRRRRATW